MPPRTKLTLRDDTSTKTDEWLPPMPSWPPIASSRNAKWAYSTVHNVTAKADASVLGSPFAMSQLGRSSDSSSASQPSEPAIGTPPPQPTAIAPMDIEPSTPPHPPAPVTATEIAGGEGIRDATADAKRVAKLVQPVALAVAAGSLVLFVNGPPVDANHPKVGVAHAAYIAFVCLGLFTSLGLSMHAVVRSSPDPRVAKLHKRLMLVAIAFVLCAAAVRFSLVLPGAAPWQFFLAFLLPGSLASLLFVKFAGNFVHGDHTDANARA